MKAIKKDIEQLLRVLLVLIIELLLELGNNTFQLKWGHRFLSIEPELLHEFCKSYRQFPLSAKGVLIVDLFFKIALQKVV